MKSGFDVEEEGENDLAVYLCIMITYGREFLGSDRNANVYFTG